MRKFIAGAAMAALLPLCAAPAIAGDLLYEASADSLTEHLDGKPFWLAQAECAGLFGAAASYLTDRGDADGAQEAGQLAISFANDAIARLRQDRGVSKKDALLLIEPAVLSSREKSISVVSAGDTSASSTWNFARSACLDIAETYATQVSY
jgi:hypothetical protein